MRVFLAVLLVGSGSVIRGAAAGDSMRVCSFVPVAIGRDTTATYFIGRAGTDTILTGPGTVSFEMRFGHWGRPSSRSIYGRVVRVEQLGGNGRRALEAVFARRGIRDVVVVPWDYDPACQPVPWVGVAHWVETTQPGFYRVRLRAESLWVDGRPVLDAFRADMEPYPHGVFFQRGYRGTDALRNGPALTPREYFELYAALPDWGLMTRDPTNAAILMHAWERSHLALGRSYPAAEVLKQTRASLQFR